MRDTETNTKPEPQAATLEQLKAALPDADAEFLIDCLQRKRTLQQAKDAHTDALRAKLQNRDDEAKRLADENATLKTAAAAPGGAKPVTEVADKTPSSDADGDAIGRFNAAVRQKTAAGMSRAQAVVAVATADPALHQAYLLATNPGRREQRLIEEKYDTE